MTDIDTKKNSSHKNLGVLKGDFCGFGCPNDALLAKTMGCCRVERAGGYNCRVYIVGTCFTVSTHPPGSGHSSCKVTTGLVYATNISGLEISCSSLKYLGREVGMYISQNWILFFIKFSNSSLLLQILEK